MSPKSFSIRNQGRVWSRSWRESSLNLKLTIFILALVGTAGLIGGIILDVHGAWTSLPFVTNIVSGATAASFGVIFALVILQTITRNQAEAQNRREAERLYRGGLVNLRTAALAIFTSASREDLRDILQVLAKMDRSIPSFKDLVSVGNKPPDYSNFVSRLPGSAAEVQACAGSLAEHVPRAEERREAWTTLQAQWRFFSVDVRGRAFTADLQWLSPEEYHKLQVTFGNPESSPTDLLGPLRYAARNYAHAVNSAILGAEDDRGSERVSSRPTDHKHRRLVSASCASVLRRLRLRWARLGTSGRSGAAMNTAPVDAERVAEASKVRAATKGAAARLSSELGESQRRFREFSAALDVVDRQAVSPDS